jgi:DNA polymerase-4
MEIKRNPAPPEIMHVDLNSAFAMTEQQANPLLRGRPVGVTNRLVRSSICIAASYEAKAVGIGVGTRNFEAQMRAPGFVMLEADPPKYQHIHKKLRAILESYSPESYMKSVDEGIIDFRGMAGLLKGRSLEDIGLEIKQRVRDEVGDYMTVNVGIGQNRWTAKLAAGFNKPDGLLTIDNSNAAAIYTMIDLLDLPYINYRYRARLNEAGIFTPLEFYQAPEPVLWKQVFKSVVGRQWYLKLRGYETEPSTLPIRTVGKDYVLEHRTADPEEIASLLYKFAIELAERLKKNELASRGLWLGVGFTESWWAERHMYKVSVWRADQIYSRLLDLFQRAPSGQVVRHLSATCYSLAPADHSQQTLYDDDFTQQERIQAALNLVNGRYGAFTIQPASILHIKNPMKKRIPFGSVRYFDEAD